ncbi:MAG: hypothetical protein FJ100_06455 [Deltaproteobacteria bacterium]|nr:hypothetical protein [Deltaproteobacteria bacterium]
MLNQIKDIAAKQVGKVLASDAAMNVLGSPQLKQAVVTAINLRAEARDALERRVKDVATALELVTREDVAKLRRSIRDLEDHLAELQGQLAEAQADLAATKGETGPDAESTEEPPAAKAKKPRRAKAG